METLKTNIPGGFQRNTAKRLVVWAIIVAALLVIPFLLMKFQIAVHDPGSGSEQVNWTVGDFIFAGVLLFGSATVYELATRNMSSSSRRFIVGAAVFVVLAIIWIGGATGFGAE